MNVKILTQTTPNPYARKFIVNQAVKYDGKATFTNKQEAESVVLARDIFDIAGIEQVHLFDNFITVTINPDANDWQQVEPQVRAIIETRMPNHNANFEVGAKAVSAPVDRTGLTPEILKIEEVLDRTIRPGLQGDGGDLEVVSYENNVLQIRYQGACGTCPSSLYGTLQAIESILQTEFNHEVRVEVV